MAMAAATRPDPTRMYGITHDPAGAPVVRVPRVVKVGIGLPKGKDVRVFIDAAGNWKVRVGDSTTACKDREDARRVYRKAKDAAPEVKYPRKLEYFTFTRPDGAGGFDPDFEAIEAHGSFPRELDIMFTEDRPLHASYQMWTASELKCHGDGVNALRVLSMASTKTEKESALMAQESGEKYFPIESGCFTCGCPYAQPTMVNGKERAAECKPHARIQFQLLSAPRLGGVAQFDTTSIRSISQLFSCLHTFYQFTGQGDPDRGFVSGIPLKLVLHPFKVNHNGQAGTAYSVSLEFRTESALRLRQQLMDHAMEFRRAITPGGELKRIEAGVEIEDADEETFETGAAQAAAFTAEFVEEEDAPVPEVPEGGSIEQAAEVAIRKIAEDSGYTIEQVRECYDDERMMELLAYKFGPAPNAKSMPAAPEAKVCSCQSPECQVLSDNSVPSGRVCREGRTAEEAPRPVTEMPKPAAKLQFGRKPK